MSIPKDYAKEEFDKLTTPLLDPEVKSETITQQLAEMIEKYNALLSLATKLDENETALQERVKSLQENNMQLYLKIASRKEESAENDNSQGRDNDDKMSFDDLFDKDGDIK